jgi:hypothetical protein
MAGDSCRTSKSCRTFSIDFSSLNNGEWKTACLFGGYTRPLDEMRLRGASISENDTARFTEAGTRGFRLGHVEEQEKRLPTSIPPTTLASFTSPLA